MKLYKSVVQPSCMFGCELWDGLNSTEKLMLERMQRFCAKLIQKLNPRTRSDVCCGMLGLISVESYIDKAKLNFLRRLAVLPGTAHSKCVFLLRLFQYLLLQPQNESFCSEIVKILHKVDLYELFDSIFLKSGLFPDKLPWKKMVINRLKELEVKAFNDRTDGDNDFKRFKAVHQDIHKPNKLWYFARANPNKLKQCETVAKYIAESVNIDSVYLCEFCGRLYYDKLTHFSTVCSATEDIQSTFWNLVVNNYPVEVSVCLSNLNNEEFVETLLGANSHVSLDDKVYNELYTLFIEFIQRLHNEVVL